MTPREIYKHLKQINQRVAAIEPHVSPMKMIDTETKYYQLDLDQDPVETTLPVVELRVRFGDTLKRVYDKDFNIIY